MKGKNWTNFFDAPRFISVLMASNRQKRIDSRMSIAALKATVERPDLVDSMDNCAQDPVALLFCKGYKNSVPVPRHWSNKRNYLGAKRAIDKRPFQLPEYVEQTGIAKIRQAVLAKEAEKDIKAKQRAKMRPKTGKLDIDYQVLHDAFFKYQTKPAHLTKHGDLYYEGRESETRYVHKKPGQLSVSLREAMGMMEGSPPPWLINMQRFGPPPAYPNLRIPGLNAPIPLGAEWGYHPGGWGRAPVDQYGNPVYGGVWNPEVDRAPIVDLETVQGPKDVWGEYLDLSDSDDDDDVDDVVQTAPVVHAPVQKAQPAYNQGVAINTNPTAPNPTSSSTSLYKVLPQRSAPTQPGALFPSRNIYELQPSDDATGGIATAAGIAQRATEVESADVLTADQVRKQLSDLESSAAKVADAKKAVKKKAKFKF